MGTEDLSCVCRVQSITLAVEMKKLQNHMRVLCGAWPGLCFWFKKKKKKGEGKVSEPVRLIVYATLVNNQLQLRRPVDTVGSDEHLTFFHYQCKPDGRLHMWCHG